MDCFCIENIEKVQKKNYKPGIVLSYWHLFQGFNIDLPKTIDEIEEGDVEMEIDQIVEAKENLDESESKENLELSKIFKSQSQTNFLLIQIFIKTLQNLVTHIQIKTRQSSKIW